jgi:hypothetical protein
MRFSKHNRALIWTLAISLALVPAAARADIIQGADYLNTTSGQFDFGSPIGTVNFVSNPIGPGTTDTIVQRQSDAVVNGPAVPIMITALSLESAAPVNIGGSFFDVFVSLDPANLANDTGTLSVMGTSTGGTFSSTLDVFFEIQFIPLVPGPAPSPIFGETMFTGSGTWTSQAPPESVNPGAGFFPTGTEASLLASHSVQPATFVPEPSTWIHCAWALLAMPVHYRLRRQRKA